MQLLLYCFLLHTKIIGRLLKFENIEVKGIYDYREKLSVTGRVVLETKNKDGENIRIYVDLNSIDFSCYTDIDTGASDIINF